MGAFSVCACGRSTRCGNTFALIIWKYDGPWYQMFRDETVSWHHVFSELSFIITIHERKNIRKSRMSLRCGVRHCPVLIIRSSSASLAGNRSRKQQLPLYRHAQNVRQISE